MEKINCRRCKHYYITWDKAYPNGCKAYAIKSLQMPSIAVQKSSGEPCKAYEQKAVANTF